MRRFLCGLGWALCLSLQSVPAGAQAPLTLEGALARAHDHPRLRAAASARDAAGGAALQAGALPNPELSVLVEDTRRATRTTTVALNQPLELGGQRGARRGAAELAQRQAQAELATREAEVRAAVVAAWYELALAQRRQALSAELAGLAARATQAAAQRVAAGKAPPIEETRARVAEAQVRASAAGTDGDARAARQQLAAAMGIVQPDFERVADPLDRLPDPAAWSTLEQRIGATPAWQQADLEVQRREALSSAERGKRLPDLTLTLGLKRDEQFVREGGRNQAVLGFSLPLPLFDRNQGALAEALKREDQARAEREVLRAEWHNQAVQARERLAAAVAEARSLREHVLPAAAEALSLATRGYELGRYGFIELLDAQRTRFDAELQALRAAAAAWRAEAELQRLAAAPFASGRDE